MDNHHVSQQPQTTADISDAENKKSPRAMLIGMIAGIVVGVAGIGFGIYGIREANNAKSQQPGFAQNERLADGGETTIDASSAQTVDANAEAAMTPEYKTNGNPVISSPDSDTAYESSFSSSYYQDSDSSKQIIIGIRNGEISSCRIHPVEEPGLNRDAACSISAPNSKIYKIVEAGEGHDNSGSIICFIMEDGTVEYFPLYEAFQTGNFNSRGILNINKSVTDIISIGVVATDPDSVNGYGSTAFVFSDGTYRLFDKSMLK